MMFTERRLVVPQEAAGRRLDRFLTAEFPTTSRSRLQELIKRGRVAVEGAVVLRPGFLLRGGEVVRVEWVERPPLRAVPEALPLDILYEDDQVVAVNKPAGMVVHVGAGAGSGTLVNALLHHFGRLSSVGGPLRPGIVHRLDKMTSGVLLVAKNDEAHQSLARQFARREIQKCYWALVHGRMKQTQGTIRLPVARDRVRRTRMTARRKQGRAAETAYRVLVAVEGYSLLEIELRTGRTHQIRVHLSALGRPVVGDTLYGAPKTLRLDNRTRPTLNRNFLHARLLGFRHPRTGEKVAVEAPLPGELCGLLEVLGMEVR